MGGSCVFPVVRDRMPPEAFVVGAADLYRRLSRIAFSLCGDRGLAEECAQEALARGWLRVERGRPLDSLEAWTTRVALNWCRSQMRRQGAESRAMKRLPPPDQFDRSSDLTAGLSAEVHQAVLGLPFRQREVVVLHYLLDYDVAHIAAVTGISQGAVKNALFHGRANLAVRLRTDDPPTDPVHATKRKDRR